MKVLYVISVLLALAFAAALFAAAIIRIRADEDQVERWKQYAERWNAYRAEVRTEKKRLKEAEKARKAYIHTVRERMFWKSIFGA